MANISFIAWMTVKEGREEEYIGHCKALAEKVTENEPGVLYYRFFKLREPRRYAIVESFADEAAEEIHMNSAHLNEIAPSRISAHMHCGALTSVNNRAPSRAVRKPGR